jgi:hypothetical protein
VFVATAPKKTGKLQRSGIALNVESMVARCRIKHAALPGLELCSLSNPINITPRRGSIMRLPAHARNGAEFIFIPQQAAFGAQLRNELNSRSLVER